MSDFMRVSPVTARQLRDSGMSINDAVRQLQKERANELLGQVRAGFSWDGEKSLDLDTDAKIERLVAVLEWLVGRA